MPSLGADMEHGRIIEWLVKPGDHVHRGDIIATVDTDKALMDVESFDDGVVAELLVEPGTDVAVGTLLARITGTPDGVHPSPSSPPAIPGPPPEPPALPVVPAAGRGHRVASPPVRHLAHRLGVDLATIAGTGKGGAVTRADVERAAAPPEPAAPPETVAPRAAPVPPAARISAPGRVRSSPLARRLAREADIELASIPGTGPDGAVVVADVHRAATAPARKIRSAGRGPAARTSSGDGRTDDSTAIRAKERAVAMRRAIGTLMATSKTSIPHYYLSTTIDLRAATAWMQSTNAGRPVTRRLVPAALLLKAAATAARDVPDMNGFWEDGAFHPSPSVHLGVAVALRGGGLVAPALHDADALPVDDLMERLRDLVTRARSGRLRRAEMSDPTITVTNLGDLGVETVFGVIYPPQVALVGFGRVVEQPFAVDGLLGVRPAVTATLSADHRVSDGLRGGRFLDLVGELLQHPEEL